jgi:hypothetical protein
MHRVSARDISNEDNEGTELNTPFKFAITERTNHRIIIDHE